MAYEEVRIQPIGHSQQQNTVTTKAKETVYLGRTVSQNIYDVDCQDMAKNIKGFAPNNLSGGGP